jgi:hypothetical protein
MDGSRLALALLGEMDAPLEPEISSECARFLDPHQLDDGAFTCPGRLDVKRWVARHPRAKAVRWEQPFLTRNMIRTLLVFRVRGRQEGEKGNRLDARASARRWRLEGQLSREEGEAQQLHAHRRATLGLLRDSKTEMDPENETVD